MTLPLHEFILNADRFRLEKLKGQLKLSHLPSLSNDSLDKNTYIDVYEDFMTGSSVQSVPPLLKRRFGEYSLNADESALWGIWRVVSEISYMDMEDEWFIGQVEILCSLGELGVSKFVQEQIFRVFDRDGDGMIDFKEYCMGVAVILNGKFEEKVKMVFKILDFDKNSKVDREELARVYRVVFSSTRKCNLVGNGIHRMNEKELEAKVEATMRVCDLNNDGFIDFYEFRTQFQQSPHMNRVFNFIFSNPLL
ncbi:hypothetical protein C9374_006836 [Naegleria lovaniensis]|uniref:EF-hand domain-containing protein n=1 Tax=Naegleria lovaniensis TaxID=51637 RepID=A0AA88GYH6_NAELO|nr:uncharacterized protein C9374_006836 [Naegleria lovaniensis]KAG2393305.1 hypothetical protein C9374_006836 [Naegleria lovaniensis]